MPVTIKGEPCPRGPKVSHCPQYCFAIYLIEAVFGVNEKEGLRTQVISRTRAQEFIRCGQIFELLSPWLLLGALLHVVDFGVGFRFLSLLVCLNRLLPESFRRMHGAFDPGCESDAQICITG